MSQVGSGSLEPRSREKSRKAIENAETLDMPKAKKMRGVSKSEPAPSVDVDTEGDSEEDEEEEEDAEEEEEEDKIPLQKLTFVMGVVQGKVPVKNEFYWEAKSSTTLGKVELALPIALDDLIEALKPLFRLKCFKDFTEADYRFGIVSPLLAAPPGRKKPINQVHLVDDKLKLDENTGDNMKVVVIEQPKELDTPSASARKEGGAEAGDAQYTITVLIGAIHHGGNYLASEPTGEKHSMKSSVTVRLGDSRAPMLGVESPLTLQKIKTYTEDLWKKENDELVELDNYEIRLLSATEKAKTGETASAPCLFTCNRIIGERFVREQHGHITIVLVHPGLVDDTVAKSHGSAVDLERVKSLAVCKLANETSKYLITTGKHPQFMEGLTFDHNISRDAQQTCMRELYLGASKLVQEDLDWLKPEDVKRGQLLIEALLRDKEKMKGLKLPAGCALVTIIGVGDKAAKDSQAVSTTAADTSISNMEVVYKVSVRVGASSNSSWVDDVGTTTVDGLSIKLAQLPHNRVLSVQTAFTCGKDNRFSAETFLPLEKIVATKGNDDSYFVVNDGQQRTSLRIKLFIVQDPPLDEDSDPALDE